MCLSLSMRLLLAVGVLLACLATTAGAARAKDGEGGKDDRSEVRAVGSCSRGVSSELRLESRDGALELELELEEARPSSSWRIAVVQERRVVWRGRRSARRDGTLKLRRALENLPGVDRVSVQAWGPSGVRCRVTGTLAES